MITKALFFVSITILLLNPLTAETGFAFQKDFRETNNSLPEFNLRRIKPGMSLATVKKKLGKNLALTRESPFASKYFKISTIKARNNVALRFYKNRLFGILVVYPRNQWSDNNDLAAWLAKELRIKNRWKTVVKWMDLEIKMIFFRTYQVNAQTNNIEHSIYIYNETTMERLRRQLRKNKREKQ